MPTSACHSSQHIHILSKMKWFSYPFFLKQESKDDIERQLALQNQEKVSTTSEPSSNRASGVVVLEHQECSSPDCQMAHVLLLILALGFSLMILCVIAYICLIYYI